MHPGAACASRLPPIERCEKPPHRLTTEGPIGPLRRRLPPRSFCSHVEVSTTREQEEHRSSPFFSRVQYAWSGGDAQMMHPGNCKLVAIRAFGHLSGLLRAWLRWYARERRMAGRLLALLTLSLLARCAEGRCGERLERALDMMQQRGNAARRKYDADSADLVYHQRLRSAPIDVSVTKIIVEIPAAGGRDGSAWARVERCSYEPSNNSIRTRVGFGELAVSGLVQLRPLESAAAKESPAPQRALPAESCRMSLRLRRAGMEFYTSPIARGRGQMRIRTESSFLEPRFASIYAYGCRPAFGAGPTPYDRVEPSEPRKREISDEAKSASSDSNSVSSGATAEEKDTVEEENRLSDILAPLTTTDAMLDTLWRSRGDIAREMEDVFLRSASQAITHYIERQLHPAIKETLMLSMGYTISYG